MPSGDPWAHRPGPFWSRSDRYRSRRAVAQSAVRSDLVVELSPVFNRHPGLLEDLVVQGQVSHRSAQPGIALYPAA